MTARKRPAARPAVAAIPPEAAGLEGRAVAGLDLALGPAGDLADAGITVGAGVFPHAARALTVGGIGPRVIDAAARAEAAGGLVDRADVVVLAVPAGEADRVLGALEVLTDLRREP